MYSVGCKLTEGQKVNSFLCLMINRSGEGTWKEEILQKKNPHRMSYMLIMHYHNDKNNESPSLGDR